MSLKTSIKETITSFLTVTATLGSASISIPLSSFTRFICHTRRHIKHTHTRHELDPRAVPGLTLPMGSDTMADARPAMVSFLSFSF